MNKPISRQQDRRWRLHSLMYTLLYPAVLGTMIVAIIASTARIECPIGMFTFNWIFAVFLALYFSSQQVQNTLDRDDYTGPMFVSDIIEIGFMYKLFLWLGMRDSRFAISGEADANWIWFYSLLVGVFLLPVAARAYNYKDRKGWKKIFPVRGDDKKMLVESWNSGLSILAAALSILAFLLYPTASLAPILLFVPLVIYIWRIVFRNWVSG